METADPNDLVANSYNPNKLTGVQLRAYALEIRAKQSNDKIIKVRENLGRLEIVDGEQTWRAAIDAGLTTVRIERIAVDDDFEARRYTYRANIHGNHDPVKLGRMIADMRTLRPNLSNCDLAKELGCTEGTIRNRLIYADLAALAATDRSLPPEGEIARLSVKEVRCLLDERNGGEGEIGPADIDQGDGEKAKDTPVAKAKKLWSKMAVEDRQAFLDWASGQA